jgi:iron(III) transport system permease protein
VLVAFCLVLLGLEHAARGRRRRSRVGSGVARTATTYRLGPFAPLWTLGLVALAGLALGLPLFSLVRWLVRGSSSSLGTADLGTAFGSSLGLAVAGGVITTVAALPVAWLAVRYRSALSTRPTRCPGSSSAWRW